MREESDDAVMEVMDTPEKSKIAASVGQFEESPVFNFLNNLSPIKPIKSAHMTHSINPLSFASLPSIFASPHVASLRDSKFLQRHNLPDPSKPEFSSIKEIKDEKNTDGDGKELDCESLLNNGSDNQSKFAEIIHTPSNDSNVLKGTSQTMKGASYNDDRNVEVNWENFIDLSIFQSPNAVDSCKKRVVDRGATFFASIEEDMIQMKSQCAVVGDENEPEGSCTQPHGEDHVFFPENAESDEAHPGEKMDDENFPGFYRGTRRRCLLFEMTGARKKHSNEKNYNAGDSSDLQTQLQGSGESIDEQQQLTLMNRGKESSRNLLPGIGLHLNAIASSTPKDHRIFNQDSSSSSGRFLIGPNMSVNVRTSTNAAQESERKGDENGVFASEDAQLVNEEANPSSPKKKRRREQQAGEAEACKRCNCKKSKCLKLYCECFAAGVYCVEPCACVDCFNKPIHEDTVLATRKQIESRNPLAFAPKVIRGSDPSLLEIADDSTRTPASARHKRGCNCKKSGCHKKYCECYQGGVGCSINCRCEGCKNAFGKKDGSVGIEHEEDEEDKNMNTDTETPATPARPVRKSIPQPIFSKNRPPRSSSSSSIIPPMIGSSSSSSSAAAASANFYTNNTGYKNPNFPQLPPPKFDKHFEAAREAPREIPDFLLENSPQSSSPNGKRVSPPHNGGASSGLKSSRKLILQSIPSFPSLTSNQ